MNVFYFVTLFLSIHTYDLWVPKIVNFSSIRKQYIKDKGFEEVEFLVKTTDTIYEYDKDSRNYPIILDIGANIGNFTMGVAPLYTNAKIYSFEPFKLSLDVLLEKSLDYKNVEVINEAVSNITVLNQPFYSTIGWQTHKNTISSLLENQEGYSVCEYANLTTLSYFMKRKNISNIFFMKIDTEGYDGTIIKDSINLFYEHKIKYLYFEYTDRWKKVNPNIQLFEITDELMSAGYNLYYENMNNFISFKYEIHPLKLNNYVSILAVLKGQSFEKNMMNRLCKYCNY